MKIIFYPFAISVFILLQANSFFCVHAGVIGSYTTPSREPVAVFSAGDTSNEMRGFGMFESGFTLQNASTSCLFNSYFPVGGQVTLNGGVLTMAKDLLLTSTATIVNGGTIHGNFYALELPRKNSTFTLPAMTINNTRMVCNTDVVCNGTITCGGIGVLDAHGNTIDCSAGTIAVAAGGSLCIKNGVLKGVHTNSLLCLDNAATLSLSNITVIHDGAYSFTQGRLVIADSVVMTGASTFVYQSSVQSFVQPHSCWHFEKGMTLSYAPTIAARNLIMLSDGSSVLSLNTTNLLSTTTGLCLTKGIVRVDGQCTIASDAVYESQAICFGDGVSQSNDITIELLAESGFYIASGFVAYNNIS